MTQGEDGSSYAGPKEGTALEGAGEDVEGEDGVVVRLVFGVEGVWPEAGHGCG